MQGRRGSVGANASVWEEGRVLAAAVEQRCVEVRGLLWERSHDNKWPLVRFLVENES